MKTTFVYLFVLAFIMPFGSCLKEKEDKKLNCRIGTITEVDTRSKRITIMTYNTDGKIATMDISENNAEFTSKVFTYSGNTINVTVARTVGASVTNTRDSITVDDKGRAVNIRMYRLNNTRWTNNHIVYNGDELIRTEITTESSPTPQVSQPTYVNGNLVSTVAPWGNSSCEYYTDQELQQGDYLEITNLVTFGISIGPNKNLLKTLNIGSNTTNFQYEMNSLGQIAKVTAISNGRLATTLTYNYVCE